MLHLDAASPANVHASLSALGVSGLMVLSGLFLLLDPGGVIDKSRRERDKDFPPSDRTILLRSRLQKFGAWWFLVPGVLLFAVALARLIVNL